MMLSATTVAPLRTRAARRARTSASQRAGVVCSAKAEARFSPPSLQACSESNLEPVCIRTGRASIGLKLPGPSSPCCLCAQQRVNRREAVFSGAAALVAALTLGPAREVSPDRAWLPLIR